MSIFLHQCCPIAAYMVGLLWNPFKMISISFWLYLQILSAYGKSFARYRLYVFCTQALPSGNWSSLLKCVDINKHRQKYEAKTINRRTDSNTTTKLPRDERAKIHATWLMIMNITDPMHDIHKTHIARANWESLVYVNRTSQRSPKNVNLLTYMRWICVI